MKKTVKKIMAVVLAFALAVPVVNQPAAAGKAPALKVVGLKDLFGTSSSTIKVKKNGAKKIIKTTWSVNKAGKSAIKLTKKTKTSVKVTAKNTNGKATVTAKVKYTVGKKTKTVSLKQKFTTDTNGESDGDELSSGVLIDEKSPDWIGAMDAAKNTGKLVVVAGLGDLATSAWFSYHEKAEDGTWHMRLTTPAFIGKNGLGKTKEGDSMTPVGEFKFNRAFGIADDPGCAIPYTKVTADHYWSGDPNYHYNELVDIKDYPELAMEDSEHIIDYTYHYQYCLNISYNAEGKPGLGSAIFLHCFGPVKPFTGGCVAIPEAYMKQFMQIVDEDTVIVIDSAEKLFNDEWPGSLWPINPNA